MKQRERQDLSDIFLAKPCAIISLQTPLLLRFQISFNNTCGDEIPVD